MKKIINYIIIFSVVILTCLCTTGCDNDAMDEIEIVVTNYANEFIVNKLYSNNAKITSIYPNGVDIYTYKISNKQKKEYAKKEIFVYNGLIENERNLAIDLLDINPKLKIIDTAYVLETDYAPEELWLNPSSLLMMTQNVKNGLLEYVSSTYLQKEIISSYENLKIELSTLDAEYRNTIAEANDKTIIINDSSLKYLEKFGLTVYCIDNDATEKTLATVRELVNSKAISYIITFSGNEDNNNTKDLLEAYPNIKKIELNKLSNLSEQEKDEKKDYFSIMTDNLSLLGQELYQ